MNRLQTKQALAAAVSAARAAGELMSRNFSSPKIIRSEHRRDIKLELDVRCQELIGRRLGRVFPGVSLLGEEGTTGHPDSEYRWVVDPIDGTVNFTYQIPHACVSIALQKQSSGRSAEADPFETILGVVYDPFCRELWTALRGRPARLNGKIIRVSRRRRLAESVISIGFSKDRPTLEAMLPAFQRLVYQVRKIRIMGAAALALVYVASGRFDAYVETGVRLWDIAAGGLILECAGGEFWHRAVSRDHRYQLLANNGLIRRNIETVAFARGKNWRLTSR